MNCPDCKSIRNHIANSVRKGDQVLRLRECDSCGAIWPTTERYRLFCEECGRCDWQIHNTQHDGPDRKFRRRKCKQCGFEQINIEKKISVDKIPA